MYSVDTGRREKQGINVAKVLLVALIILGSIVFSPTATQIQQANADPTFGTTLYVDAQSVAEGEKVTARGFVQALNSANLTGLPVRLELNGTPLTFDSPISILNALGDFSANFTAPSEVGYWNLAAYFDGNATYLASSASTIFATVEPGAMYFQVTDGQLDYFDVNLPLTGFNFTATIKFESVQTDYFLKPVRILVSQCTSPDTPSRYLPLRFDTDDNDGYICLEIFPGPLRRLDATNPGIWVTMDYTGIQALPGGYSESNIDLFHQNVLTGEITEITSSRNVETQEISGRALNTGRFIVGIGLHGQAPEGAVRQHVFIGDNQPVMFRNVTNTANMTASVVSISPEEVTLDQAVTITLNYTNGNLDVSSIDNLSVQINSTSSTPDYVTIVFTENAANSGIFTGSLTLTSGSTSGSSLHASNTDTLSFTIVGQEPTDGRFKAILDGVSEAGVVELSDYKILESELLSLAFVPVVGAVNMTLVDASLESTAQVHVTMSYANSLIGTNDPTVLKIFHKKPGSGWDTAPPAAKLDTANLLVSATFDTTTPGLFALGFSGGSPGGAGGGLGKPGVGVVLDFLVPFASPPPSSPPTSSPESSPSSSRSSSRSSDVSGAITKQVIEGDNVQTTVPTKDGSTIKVTFETIVSGGTLTISEKSVSDFSSIFDSATSTHGSVSIEGAQYSTAGSVFDIDASKVTFSGSIDVTIPYDESSVTSDGLPEGNARFLHYDGTSWEDATIGIDINANTVTGRVSTTSPVVVGIANDGTFGPAYFELNPLNKVGVMNTALLAAGGNEITADIKIDQQIAISNTIKNFQRSNQTYTVIVQLVDSDGYVQSLNWQTGMLQSGKSIDISKSWTAERLGTYTIQIFVWNAIEEDPYPLSSITVHKIRVS